MNTSKRLEKVPSSPIRKLVPLAQQAKSSGVHVYHLNIGDPDIKTPDAMLRVLAKWQINPVGYELSQGNPGLIDALVWYYKKLGFDFLSQKNIQITLGGSEAISMALFATCEQGDEVIVFEPLYANYNTYAAVGGVRLIPVATSIDNGFHLPDKQIIQKYISKRTKAILFCSPNNPTGTVYTKEEVNRLVAIAKKHNLILLSDEVYREYTYDGRVHVSLLSIMKSLPDQTVVLDSLSKRYSICGARVGALVSLNPDIMAGVLRIAQGRLSAGLIDQTLAAELAHVPDSWLKEVHDEFERRRDVLYSGLKKIPGVTIPKPEGAFYTIVGLPVADSEHFCKWLLTDFRDNNETVMLAPASGFYATPGMGKNEVRIAYVLNRKSLTRCVSLLGIALSKYRNS